MSDTSTISGSSSIALNPAPSALPSAADPVPDAPREVALDALFPEEPDDALLASDCFNAALLAKLTLFCPSPVVLSLPLLACGGTSVPQTSLVDPLMMIGAASASSFGGRHF